MKRFSPKLTWGEGPERLKNLYFLYLVELRALAKVAPYLEKVQLYLFYIDFDYNLFIVSIIYFF